MASGKSSPRDEIRRVAAFIEKRHVTAVDEGVLLRVAAVALYGEAGTAAWAIAAGASPAEMLDEALSRLHTARPTLSDRDTIAIAVKAMAGALSDSSAYLPAEELGPVGGVGLVVGRGENYPGVVRVMGAAAAAKAGVQPGDELRAVDGRTTAGLTPAETVRLLRGPVGSRVKLLLARQGGTPFVQEIERAILYAGPFECRIVAGRILYLGVTDGLGAQTVSQVRALPNVVGEPAERVILDLRGNFGGLLSAASDLADTFLESGMIVSAESRLLRSPEKHLAKPGTSILEHARLVVLVDRETGSGAEAVAAAIQDNHRGTILGSKTSSKASIDVLHAVPGGALKLAIARMYRPNGEPIDDRGVTPDVLLADPPADHDPPVADANCPGYASSSVANDPGVIHAASLLLGNEGSN